MDKVLVESQDIIKDYSKFVNDEIKKEAIIGCYLRDDLAAIKDLPFFNPAYGYNFNQEELDKLIKLLKIDIDEESLDSQQSYYELLDKIIDGICNIRYMKDKFTFQFPTSVALNDAMIYLFSHFENKSDFNYMVKKINSFVEYTLPIEYVTSNINRLYDLYSQDEVLDIKDTEEFYNKILNRHRNNYLSREKRDIIEFVCNNLDVSKRKKVSILNGKKLAIISELIKNENFSQLGTTKEELLEKFNSVKSDIMNNKDVKKSGVILSDSFWNSLENVFFKYGYLASEMLYTELDVLDMDIARFITNKYEKMKMKFLEKVKLSSDNQTITNSDKKKLGFNQNNFVIGSKDRYCENMALLLLKLDNSIISEILDNGHLLNEIKYLLPLVGLVPSFSVTDMLNILRNYSQVKDRILLEEGNDNKVYSSNFILSRFDDLITLSNAYGSCDDLSLFCLGKDLLSSLESHEAGKYLDFYKKILHRTSCNIPSVNVKSNFSTFESGKYSDSQRLLIGKKFPYSCIDLNNLAGEKTFEEVLLGDNGDVILVKDEQGELVSRILVFRRGNVVQMISPSWKQYSYDLYQEIGYQIMGQAIYAKDNIDYVFVNKNSLLDKNYSYVDDYRFLRKFPHADGSNKAVLVCSKKKYLGEEEGSLFLDFEVIPNASYKKVRMPINYQPTEEDITRLKALRISMENDDQVRENMARYFEPFCIQNYKNVVCGEDWYIATKNDGTIEAVTLPTEDCRKDIELSRVKEKLGLVESSQKSGSGRR